VKRAEAGRDMPNAASPAVTIASEVAARLYRRARAGRWELSLDEFSASLARSAGHRFAAGAPAASDLERYLDSLHLEDLALACACARGVDTAWEHFVREFRPILLRVAGAAAPPDIARELADSLYADLYGIDDRDGRRRSLFDYFHGRSTLAGWLRVVLAQRAVDRARAARRFEPLPDADAPAAGEAAAMPIVEADPPDLDAARFLPLVRRALASALAALGPRDRLRLSLYYARGLTLAVIGRMLGESEATVSRKLERTRRDLRAAIARRLGEQDGLSEEQIAACFEHARADQAFDLARALPPDATVEQG
jgi:RNA polymerase sigma-70 factor (ECF subfamily)